VPALEEPGWDKRLAEHAGLVQRMRTDLLKLKLDAEALRRAAELNARMALDLDRRAILLGGQLRHEEEAHAEAQSKLASAGKNGKEAHP
jgi:hypothetical protein